VTVAGALAPAIALDDQAIAVEPAAPCVRSRAGPIRLARNNLGRLA
jgi:hypothetical protein